MKRKIPNQKKLPVGRPRTFEHEAAIESAMQIFWSRGFGATSAGDLAAAMSIQRSSFYNTFGDRERVFATALQRYASTTPDTVLEQIPSDGAVAPVLIAMLREACHRLACDKEARGCLMVNSMAELMGSNPTLGPVIAKGVTLRLALLAKLFKQAVSRGEMKAPKDYEACARSFFAFLAGLNLMSKVIRREEDLWQTCRTFLTNMGLTIP